MLEKTDHFLTSFILIDLIKQVHILQDIQQW